MNKATFVAVVLTVLAGGARAQDTGWDAQSGAMLRSMSAQTAKIRAAAASSAPILGLSVDGAARYPGKAEADAEHDVTLFARRVCGPARQAACAPYCTPGAGCGMDYPVAATVSTPESALGRWIADLNFVFPDLSVSGGKVLRGTDVIGEVDELTSYVRLAKGWRVRLVVGSRSGICRERGDCPGGGAARYDAALMIEPVNP